MSRSLRIPTFVYIQTLLARVEDFEFVWHLLQYIWARVKIFPAVSATKLSTKYAEKIFHTTHSNVKPAA
jgi:hypothetical protein